MRRIVSPDRGSTLVPANGVMYLTTPVISQLRVQDSDAGGILLRGTAQKAIEVQEPTVYMRIRVASTGVATNILGRLQAEMAITTFDVYGSAAAPLPTQWTNVSPLLLWTDGNLGFDLRPYAVCQAVLKITNRSGRPLLIASRIEVSDNGVVLAQAGPLGFEPSHRAALIEVDDAAD